MLGKLGVIRIYWGTDDNFFFLKNVFQNKMTIFVTY